MHASKIPADQKQRTMKPYSTFRATAYPRPRVTDNRETFSRKLIAARPGIHALRKAGHMDEPENNAKIQ